MVHTLGTLLEDGEYKAALRRGDPFKLFGSFWNGVIGQTNPLKKSSQSAQGTGTYEALNRDSGAFSRNPTNCHTHQPTQLCVFVKHSSPTHQE